MLNSLDDKIDGIIDKIGHNYYILIILNILYFLALIGIAYVNISYITFFKIIIHTVLCLILIYKFNPLRKQVTLNKYDSILIFSTALFLLLNMGIVEYVKNFYIKNNNIKINSSSK